MKLEEEFEQINALEGYANELRSEILSLQNEVSAKKRRYEDVAGLQEKIEEKTEILQRVIAAVNAAKEGMGEEYDRYQTDQRGKRIS